MAFWKLLPLFCFLQLLCFTLAADTKWKTLRGDPPVVIARGGFSGLFPDSSDDAYGNTIGTSLPNVIVSCDVQLTKDAVGICLPDLLLEHSTNISVRIQHPSTYLVNGAPMSGCFSIDYMFQDLQSFNLKQGIYSRSPKFDKRDNPVLTVEQVYFKTKPQRLWLNVEYDAFYAQHNLSMRSYIQSISRRVKISYISSPEVNFLKSMVAARLKPSRIQFVFQFLTQEEIEPSTNRTYGSLMHNLTFIKTFASAILVPKNYIWPMDKDQYLLDNSTSIVLDAHKEGLRVYASEFANDVLLAYNYSYDPVAECLSFIDNGEFAVDGLVSDFPITPSEAIDCFSHMDKYETPPVKLLVISYDGASGIYPGCTDLAYKQAISDGVDIVDCPVQMSQDGIAFCSVSINLRDMTNAIQSPFMKMAMTIPELHIIDGIFAFSLTWSQIQSLQSAMGNPYLQYNLPRNPKFATAGKMMQFSEFLAMAKESSVVGVLVSIEHATYLAENHGLDVLNATMDALDKSGLNNQKAKKIMIASTDSAVLMKHGKKNGYERVYRVDENIRSITNSTISEIKNFASSVIINKESVFPTNMEFLNGETQVVSVLQASNLSVYVQLFSNEYPSQAWDFSDAYVEINTLVLGMSIDGVITDYPATATRYRRNQCLRYKERPSYMRPVKPGDLLKLMGAYLPPALAPNPVLTEANVTEPPLPPVMSKPIAGKGNKTQAPSTTAQNGQATTFVGISLRCISIFVNLWFMKL